MTSAIKESCCESAGDLSLHPSGPPTARIILDYLTKSVAFQDSNEESGDDLAPVGVFKGAFSFSYAAEVEKDEEKKWVLITNKVPQPKMHQLIEKMGLGQTEDIFKALKELFTNREEIEETLSKSSHPYFTLQLLVIWGRHVRDVSDPKMKTWLKASISDFVRFSYESLIKEGDSLKTLVKEFSDGVEMYSKGRKYTRLTPKKCAELLRFIRSKQDTLCWFDEIDYQLFSPQYTEDLARSVLFFKDGSVIIQFNRKKKGDCIIKKERYSNNKRYSSIKVGYDVTYKKLVVLSTIRGRALGSEGLEEDNFCKTKRGYAAAAKIGKASGVITLRQQFEKESKSDHLKFVVVMDFIEGKNLFDFLGMGLDKIKSIPHDQAISLGLEFLEGLTHIHTGCVVHNDLKPDNLMVDTEGHLYIIDFGFSGLADETGRGNPKFNGGNLTYSAPERAGTVFEDKVHQKHDVFAAGGILWDLFSEDVSPYFIWNTIEKMWEVSETQVDFDLNKQIRYVFDVIMSDTGWMLKRGVTMEGLAASADSKAQIAYLIAQMLHPRLRERPTAAEAHERLKAIQVRESACGSGAGGGGFLR